MQTALPNTEQLDKPPFVPRTVLAGVHSHVPSGFQINLVCNMFGTSRMGKKCFAVVPAEVERTRQLSIWID